MDIKKAIEYAQVSLKKVQEENAPQKRELTAKQLGEYIELDLIIETRQYMRTLSYIIITV